MIQSITYNTGRPGKRLLVLGAVHGNEICGPAAIRDIIARLERKEIALEEGRLTFVPVCNPRAHAEDKRFIERNLNRAMAVREAPMQYEEFLMNALCPLLADCDMLLDLHSYRAGGPAFAFRGADTLKEREEPYIAALGINHVVYGWDDAYAACGVKQDPIESIGTTEYARRHGAIATTVECGQHRDPSAVPVAIRAILGALRFSGLAPAVELDAPPTLRRTRIKKVNYKQREGSFARPWQHLDAVAAGEALARYADGAVITAPFAGRIIMPNECPVGQEWFYLGVEE